MMISRLVTALIHRSVKGQSQSWVFSSIAMLALGWARKKTERSEMVELQNLKPGDRYLIEALDVTHGEQLKAEKLAAKNAKAQAKLTKKTDKRTKRETKRAKKSK